MANNGKVRDKTIFSNTLFQTMVEEQQVIMDIYNSFSLENC